MALSAEGIGPVDRARLLSAQVEVALALGELDRAGVARDELDVIVAGSGAALLNAMAAVARAAVQLAAGDPLAALPELRRARTLWLHLGLPYPTVQTRMLIAAAGRTVGDDEGARLELGGALATFDRLDAGSARPASTAPASPAMPRPPGGRSPTGLYSVITGWPPVCPRRPSVPARRRTTVAVKTPAVAAVAASSRNPTM